MTNRVPQRSLVPASHDCIQSGIPKKPGLHCLHSPGSNDNWPMVYSSPHFWHFFFIVSCSERSPSPAASLRAVRSEVWLADLSSYHPENNHDCQYNCHGKNDARPAIRHQERISRITFESSTQPNSCTRQKSCQKQATDACDVSFAFPFRNDRHC